MCMSLISVSFYLSQLLMSQSVFCLRLGSMMVTLLLILLKQWKRCVCVYLCVYFSVCMHMYDIQS